MSVYIETEIPQTYLKHWWLVFHIDNGELKCFGGYDDYNRALMYCNAIDGIIVTRDKVSKS